MHDGEAGEEGADGEHGDAQGQGEEGDGEVLMSSYGDEASSIRGSVNSGWKEGDVGSSGTASSFANIGIRM
jgi:hypothetical protein